jgi:hypothetical protein
MPLPEELRIFIHLHREIAGEVWSFDQHTAFPIVLYPDGNTSFGAMPEYMTRCVMFKPGASYPLGAKDRNGPFTRLSKEYVAAGIHSLLLFDPRTYLAAEESNILTVLPGESAEETVVTFDMKVLGPQILGMPINIAKASSKDSGGPFQTTITIREERILEIRVNHFLTDVNRGYVRFNLFEAG